MPPTWEHDLDEVRRRLAALDVKPEAAAASAAVVTWRKAAANSTFFLPLPLVAQDEPSVDGEWYDDDHAGLSVSVGLDARGRPLTDVLFPGTPQSLTLHLWQWDEDGSFVEIEPVRKGAPHVRRARVIDGRVAHVVSANRGGRTSVRRLSWRDGSPVRADWADSWGEASFAKAVVAEVNARGTIDRLRQQTELTGAGIVANLATAAGLVPRELLWDGRVLRREPWPGDDEAWALVEPLAIELDRALRAAVARAAVAEPFVLEVVAQEHDDPAFPAWPPIARVAGVQWRERMRRGSAVDGAAVEQLERGVGRDGALKLELDGHLDDEALRACRVLSGALRAGGEWELAQAAGPVAAAVGDRLAELLNATPPAGAADPFLALVRIGDPYADDAAAARALASAGAEHVARFERSIASTAPARTTDLGRALTDRGALEALLDGAGLGTHARRLAHEVAAEALRLEPAIGRRSRLGGPPLLPPGTAWPAHEDGRDLTFLAAIDFGEVPACELSELLPDTGWLLFFADLGAGDALELAFADNAPGAAIRVLAAADPVEAEPRGRPLRARSVALRPVLTLSAADDAGLDAVEGRTYEEQCDALAAEFGTGRSHWIGGHALGAQGIAYEPDTFLLLHIEDDPALGLEFLDGGVIQFRLDPDALAARDWSRVIAIADSH